MTRCRCGATVRDLARHAGKCPVLYMALDTDAWPERDAEQSAGQAARAFGQARRVGGKFAKRAPGCIDCGKPVAYRGRCREHAAAEARRRRRQAKEKR